MWPVVVTLCKMLNIECIYDIEVSYIGFLLGFFGHDGAKW